MNAIRMIGDCMRLQQSSFGPYSSLHSCDICGGPSLYRFSCASCLLKSQCPK